MASEEAAKRLTDRPVWVQGVGWNLDTTYWTNRDLVYPEYVENAARIADDANHTDEETVAKIRSKDQDDTNPTPGKRSNGPKEDVGNGQETKVADSEDKKGNDKNAPGEKKPVSTSAQHNNPAPPAPPALWLPPSPPPPTVLGPPGLPVVPVRPPPAPPAAW